MRAATMNEPPVAEAEGLRLHLSSLSSSGYKGVHQSGGRFYLRHGGVCYGGFAKAVEAAVAYAKLIGEFGAPLSERSEAVLQLRAVGKLLDKLDAHAEARAKAEEVRAAGGPRLHLSDKGGIGFKGVEKCGRRFRSKRSSRSLGNFPSAVEAAVAYAEDCEASPAPLPPPPPPAPSSAAGAEAVRQAGREGLTLATSSNSNSGYKNVTYCPNQTGSTKYMLQMRVGGKQKFLGIFATAEEAALARARHLWDTTVRLLEPQPQQAPPQGAAGPSEASYEEEDGVFRP